ncbi:MAG: choice-of-anchor D domain-containing protein, partial [Deltaproteobacteria bacterium]|nr:choice-of-anchor D domain-containing protein [Deltaproteobacteria bacterium]
TPEADGEATGKLVFTTNDKDHPRISVRLKVTGKAVVTTPKFEVDAATLSAGIDFGPVTIGKKGKKILSIRNSGTSPLRLTNLKLDGDGFETALTEVLIPPSSSKEIEITAAPKNPGAVSGHVLFDTDDASNPHVSIPLTAEGKVKAVTIVDFFDLIEALRDPNISVDRAKGQVIIKSQVNFAAGKDAAPKDSTGKRGFDQTIEAIVGSIAGIEKILPVGHRIKPAVIGHTDNDAPRGMKKDSKQAKKYNHDLSERRAKVVAGILHEKIAASTASAASFVNETNANPFFRFEGKGQEMPVVDNKTRDGRAANRRTEVVLEVVRP